MAPVLRPGKLEADLRSVTPGSTALNRVDPSDCRSQQWNFVLSSCAVCCYKSHKHIMGTTQLERENKACSDISLPAAPLASALMHLLGLKYTPEWICVTSLNLQAVGITHKQTW